MRNLEECKAEIFSLSDKKIKQRRKNRNRILAFCIPMIVVVTAVAVTLPNMRDFMHKEAPEASGGDNVTQENISQAEGYDYLLESDEIDNMSAQIVEVTDVDQNNTALQLINSFYEENARPAGDAQIKDETQTEATGGNSNETYVVTLVSQSDGAVTFLIDGKQIYNRNTGAMTSVTQTELAELKEILGI